MYNESNKHLIVVLYDGIQNSVFKSLVIAPLLKKLERNENLEITLISFEKNLLDKSVIMRNVPAHDRLHLILCRRLPFLGKLSLWLSVFQLRRILRFIPLDDALARGPLASWVTLKALYPFLKDYNKVSKTEKLPPLPSLTLQARGLAAEEYNFVKRHEKHPWWKQLLHRFICRRLKRVEYEAFGQPVYKMYPGRICIEVISPALKDFLVQNYKTDPAHIILSTDDLPKSIPAEKRTELRKKIREELSIPENAYVYVYAGSAAAWQSIPEMLFYVIEQRAANPDVFFLVLSQDKETFKKYFEKMNIPPEAACVISVPAHEVSNYLCAADAGLLFRRHDIMNWVSRPTKMLEYEAAGLKIIHNHTIALLRERDELNDEFNTVHSAPFLDLPKSDDGSKKSS